MTFMYTYMHMYMYMCVYVHQCAHCAQCLCSGLWHRVRACCALSVSTTVCLFRTGEIECMFAESSLTPTHALYCPRKDGRGWKVDKLESAHVCGGRHVHVVISHSHALRHAALHYSCSVQCSLCTVSVQRSVAQSACVLRALSVHDRVSLSDRGR